MAKTVIAFLLMLLGGCAGQQMASQSFCSLVREPILISKGDRLTPMTQNRIVGIDEIGERLCGWKSPKESK